MEHKSRDRRRWIVAAKWLIVLIVAFFIVRSVLSARAKLIAEPSLSLAQIDVRWLAVAGVVYLLGLLPMAVYWFVMLRVFGQQPGWLAVLRAFYVGHLGKYVPGKAMVVVLRTGLLRDARADSAVTAVSVFAETLTMMSVGACLAAAILAYAFSSHVTLIVLAIVLMMAAGVPTCPPVFRLLVRKLRIARWSDNVEQTVSRYSWRLMGWGWLLNVVGWFGLSFSLWCTLRAIPMSPPLEPWSVLWPRLTASVSLAMVAGFLSLLPGGLGVRELVLNELMVEPFGEVTAIVSAILLRLVWLLTELLISIILYGWLKFCERRGSSPEPG